MHCISQPIVLGAARRTGVIRRGAGQRAFEARFERVCGGARLVKNSCVDLKALIQEFFHAKPLSQHTGTTRARTGADWHTHRLTARAEKR